MCTYIKCDRNNNRCYTYIQGIWVIEDFKQMSIPRKDAECNEAIIKDKQ